MRKSIKFLVVFLTACFFYKNSNAIVYNEKPEQKEKILSVMETFCKDAGGIVSTFEDTCANSCILYNRGTGKKVDEVLESCKKKKIYSCQCPEKQCLKDRKCQDIVKK